MTPREALLAIQNLESRNGNLNVHELHSILKKVEPELKVQESEQKTGTACCPKCSLKFQVYWI